MSIKSLYKIIKIEIYSHIVHSLYSTLCGLHTFILREQTKRIVFGQPTWLGCLLLL